MPLKPDSISLVSSDAPRASRWRITEKLMNTSSAVKAFESPYKFQWWPYVGEWKHKGCLDCIEQYQPRRVAPQFEWWRNRKRKMKEAQDLPSSQMKQVKGFAETKLSSSRVAKPHETSGACAMNPLRTVIKLPSGSSDETKQNFRCEKRN
ncbi:uncharacterized protein A4U43_UnF11640 [Asparagus officinalis]|uniref:Uncharacterized protein n=1 Tax=Asparagus officinalis TaxID=4686 RepID=A0A1R3L593_ASPOF|nr:uncharacterized protein A4U43_UnF11640 [Asparagus officinalis]